MLRGDMALMSETMRITGEIKALTSRIDVNNAGTHDISTGVRDGV